MMGSSSEEASATKPISLYDSSSTPLLKSDSEHNQQPESSYEPDPAQFLQISFNHDPRPFKDLAFLLLFLLLLLSTFAAGVFSVVHRNSLFSSLSSFTYSSSAAACVVNSTADVTETLTLTLTTFLSSSSSYSASSILKPLTWTLVITFLLAFPICFSLLWLLKHFAKQVVYVTLPFFVVFPIFFDVYWFVACTLSSTCSDSFPLVYRVLVLVFFLLVIALVVWILVANRHRIELTISIIGAAAEALSRNLALFGALPVLNLVLIVVYVPIVVFLVFARRNGEVEVVEGDDGVYSCAWKQDSWVPAYYALAILTMLWMLTTMVEAQVYVISGTVAQWYFAKEESSRPRRMIRSSLRNAFGPSFGTVCLSGLLIAVVRMVRTMVDGARKEGTSGIGNLILRCCVNALLSGIDFLNKFTIIFAAITGESYCTSARMTYELLKRNLLSAVFVETISTRLLVGIIFVLSALYAVFACVILNAVTDLGVDAYFVAALAWVLLILVLGFFVHVLDNVIDTVYVCYAIDRDRGEVCKQGVHEVYVNLPISRNHRPSSMITRTLGV